MDLGKSTKIMNSQQTGVSLIPSPSHEWRHCSKTAIVNKITCKSISNLVVLRTKKAVMTLIHKLTIMNLASEKELDSSPISKAINT